MKELGIYQVEENGTALVVRLPEEWLEANDLKVRDPLFSVLTLNEEIRVSLDEEIYSKKASVREIKKRPYVNLNTDHARKLGLRKGVALSLSVDVDHRILIIRRAA